MADTLTITDNRTGKRYDIPVIDGTIRAMDLRQIQVADARLRIDDVRPGVHQHGIVPERASRTSTAMQASSSIAVSRSSSWRSGARTWRSPISCSSASCRRSAQLAEWKHGITTHTMLHENIKHLMRGFRYDAHPMGVFLSTVGALSTFYPDAKRVHDTQARLLQAARLIAKTPTIAAYAYRHSTGRFYVYPDNELSFAGNFLNMLFKMTEAKYHGEPGARARARSAVHPARRPRAELRHERDARHRQLTGRPVLGDGRRRCRALRTAARRRQRGRRQDARTGGIGRERAGVHQAREERRRPAHGLRPSCLQVLRPAGADRQADRLRRLRGDGARTRCSTSRSSSSASRSRTSTSSRASCIPTWTSTRA